MLAAIFAVTAALAAAATPRVVSVDCSAVAPFDAFWRSCGYTPAEYSLREDEIENTAWIGAAPSRGVQQVRIHFLLDLLIVTSYVSDPSRPSGWALAYDWALLDSAMDWLVVNRLSPGFEIMGSPPGFPILPDSTYQESNGNGHVDPDQTLNMTRTLVTDIVLRYAARFGVAEVGTWRFETWNEPACGWGWPQGDNVTTSVFAGYTNLWDASAAGIEDAEAVLGSHFIFGGPAACRGIDSIFLQWAVAHRANGTNVYSGAPGRLDYISSHYKGGGSAAGTVIGAQGLMQWLRGTYPANPRGLWQLPFFNDEADPVVGWGKEFDWRGDARYGAMLAKEAVQHLLVLQDAGVAASNPVGLISFDAGFMNADGYIGFGQRTLLARFNGGGAGPGLPGTPFAFVRKSGLLLFSLLSKLGQRLPATNGTQPGRCAISGVATNATVLAEPFGGLATVIGNRGDGVNAAAQAAVLLYNSADTANASGPADTVAVSLSLAGLPFTTGSTVVGLHWRLDDAAGTSPEATWVAQGSPQTPTPAQLTALWSSSHLSLLANGTFSVGAGGTLVVPEFDLPLPAVSVWHFVSAPPAAPPAPANVRAYVKDPTLSLLDPASQREVLVRWDCAPAVASSAMTPVISDATATFLVQISMAGAEGPWTIAAGDVEPDFSCVAVHAAASVAPVGALFYRVAAVDYRGTQSAWSVAVATSAWPTGPSTTYLWRM